VASDKIAGGSHGIPLTVLRYIAGEFLLSLGISFLFFFVVFFVNQILLLAEDILAKNAPLAQTLLLLLYSLPSVVAIAFPFSALAGALMTSARLNSDNEILAFSSLGISPKTLYTPFLVLGLAVSLLSFAANDYLLPRGARSFKKVYADLVQASASIELAPFSVKRYKDLVVVTGEKKGEEIGNILLFEAAKDSRQSFISAATASLSLDDENSAALISMTDVMEHRTKGEKGGGFVVSSAETLLYRFTLREPIIGYSSSGPYELSTKELSLAIEKKRGSLQRRIDDAQRQGSTARSELLSRYQRESSISAPRNGGDGNKKTSESSLARGLSSLDQALSIRPKDRSLQLYELEYNKKFAIPAAGFFFSLLAFPLGLGTKRSGRTAGFGVALILSTLYWGLLFAGQTLGLRSEIAPGLAMWAPNALVLSMAALLWFLRKRGNRRIV
jgi:lipopolysaccharide export system permease protein